MLAILSLTTNIFGNQPASSGQVKPTTPSAYVIDAVRTGALFAALNGAFMKLGQRFGGKNSSQDVYYYHTLVCLLPLVSRNMKNFRGGKMDDCLSLLSDSAAGDQNTTWATLKILELRRCQQGECDGPSGTGDFGVHETISRA